MAYISYNLQCIFLIEYLQILEYIVSVVQIVIAKTTTILICFFFDLVAIILTYNLQAVTSVFVEQDIIWRHLNFFNQGFYFCSKGGQVQFHLLLVRNKQQEIVQHPGPDPKPIQWFLEFRGPFLLLHLNAQRWGLQLCKCHQIKPKGKVFSLKDLLNQNVSST